MKLNTHKILMELGEKGMTRTALAQKCGMSRQNVSAILTRGTCAPITAARLARGLGLEMAEVIKEG